MVAASEEGFTPVAGVALWGPVLDRLNVVADGTVWLTVGLMVLRPDIFGAQNPIGKVAGPPVIVYVLNHVTHTDLDDLDAPLTAIETTTDQHHRSTPRPPKFPTASGIVADRRHAAARLARRRRAC